MSSYLRLLSYLSFVVISSPLLSSFNSHASPLVPPCLSSSPLFIVFTLHFTRPVLQLYVPDVCHVPCSIFPAPLSISCLIPHFISPPFASHFSGRSISISSYRLYSSLLLSRLIILIHVFPLLVLSFLNASFHLVVLLVLHLLFSDLLFCHFLKSLSFTDPLPLLLSHPLSSSGRQQEVPLSHVQLSLFCLISSSRSFLSFAHFMPTLLHHHQFTSSCFVLFFSLLVNHCLYSL